MLSRSAYLIEAYHMEKHPEGGFFAEAFTSAEEYVPPDTKKRRALAGSIYYLLGEGETSLFHQIDCEELWYYHEGCGMRITVLTPEGDREEFLLGRNAERGERAMVAVPKGAIFAAENLEKDGFTFVYCVTVPKFSLDGYRIVDMDEIKEKYPGAASIGEAPAGE